jgi:thiol-disulfide isomerase/thioredoxin
MSKQIITQFQNRSEYLTLLKNKNNKLFFIKFGAEWCEPCSKIKETVNAFFSTTNNNIICADVDVDTSFDLYAYLKSKKMVIGIPVILCYYPDNDTYVPDDSVSGADINEINSFFTRCIKHI